MAHVITDRCVGVKDQSCVLVCPVDCIHPNTDSEPDVYKSYAQLYIDPVVCIDCGACVPACPVEAIFSDDEVPEEYRQFLEVNADYYREHR